MKRRRLLVLGGLALAAACSSSSSDVGDSADASTSDAGADVTISDSGTGDAAIGFDSAAPTPPTDAPLQGLTLFDGWEDPRELSPPVESIGWEDCSYISASGARLYFGYTQADYYALATGVGIFFDGPLRPGETRGGFEIYEATIADGGWNVAVSTVNSSITTISEAAEGVDDAEQTMAFIRFGAFPDGGPNNNDLYISKKSGGNWGVATALPSPINTPCIEDNAAISRDGKKIYFDSNRVDALGTTCKADTSPVGRTIYETTFDGTSWSDPVALGGAPNGGYYHWQIYPREEPVMYWSGSDSDCMADGCTYKASLEADGGYGDRVLIARPTPSASATTGDVTAIGETSITRDGHWMYFTYIVRTTGSDGGIDANLNLGVAHHP